MDFLTLRGDAARARTAADIVVVGEWAFINNVLPIDLDDDEMALPEYIEEQTLKVFANLEVMLAKIGATKNDVVSVKAAITRMDQLGKRFEQAYEGFFEPGHLPTRGLVGVSHLTRFAQVSMDFVVRMPAKLRPHPELVEG
jgi:enamine deaminase RidA (YjgF/YER057c/UK114 family)